MIVDLFLVYQFIRRLATPFKDWEAYKLGIIDENGNILKKRKELTTIRERNAFGVFDVMILNLKKLLAKVPGGSSRLASYAAALYLIREWNHFSDSSMLTEDISDDLIEESIKVFHDSYVNYILTEDFVNNKVTSLDTLFEEKFELTEIFDKPYAHKKTINMQNEVAYEAFIDGKKLSITFDKFPKIDNWELIFSVEGNTAVTGEGNEFKIFATVLAATKDFIKDKHPDQLTFTSENKEGFDQSEKTSVTEKSSRTKLYERLVRKFANDMGYSLRMGIKTYRGRKLSEFILTKPIKEDAPTVSAGSGAIAGIGVGPQGEPGLTPEQMKRHKARNRSGKRLRDLMNKTPGN